MQSISEKVNSNREADGAHAGPQRLIITAEEGVDRFVKTFVRVAIGRVDGKLVDTRARVARKVAVDLLFACVFFELSGDQSIFY